MVGMVLGLFDVVEPIVFVAGQAARTNLTGDEVVGPRLVELDSLNFVKMIKAKIDLLNHVHHHLMDLMMAVEGIPTSALRPISGLLLSTLEVATMMLESIGHNQW